MFVIRKHPYYQLEDTIEVLEGMKEPRGYGSNLKEFTQEFQADGKYKGVTISTIGGRNEGDFVEELQTARNTLIDHLVTNLQRRFPSVEVLDAMKVRYGVNNFNLIITWFVFTHSRVYGTHDSKYLHIF